MAALHGLPDGWVVGPPRQAKASVGMPPAWFLKPQDPSSDGAEPERVFAHLVALYRLLGSWRRVDAALAVTPGTSRHLHMIRCETGNEGLLRQVMVAVRAPGFLLSLGSCSGRSAPR